MSLGNIQDTLVKTHLVQQVQSRDADVVRAREQIQPQLQRELAREADEVVLSMTRAEEGEIREEDENREKGEGRKRRKSSDGEDGDDGEGDETLEALPPPPPMAPPIGPPPPPAVGSRKIDFFL